MDNNDIRICRYINKIIDVLPERQDNQQRDLLMVLHRMEIDTDNEGRLFDICSKIWRKVTKNPSLRFHAFKTMIAVARKYPDLSNEIKQLANDYYLDNLTDNVKKSIFNLMSIEN